MDDRLEYQTKLLEAILHTSIDNKTISIQNNLLLNDILSKLSDPGNDVKTMLIDIFSNLAAYKIVNKEGET